jgi:hypothetical protein
MSGKGRRISLSLAPIGRLYSTQLHPLLLQHLQQADFCLRGMRWCVRSVLYTHHAPTTGKAAQSEAPL